MTFNIPSEQIPAPTMNVSENSTVDIRHVKLQSMSLRLVTLEEPTSDLTNSLVRGTWVNNPSSHGVDSEVLRVSRSRIF